MITGRGARVAARCGFVLIFGSIVNVCRTLLADIASLRTEKLHQVMIRAGVSDLIKIDKNLGSMELIPVRKIFGTLLSEDYDVRLHEKGVGHARLV